MAAEREHVGIEPLFAVGVYIAAASNIDFQQIFRLAGLVQMTVVIIVFYICFLKPLSSKKTYRLILLTTALIAGIFCGLNGRMIQSELIGCGSGPDAFFKNLGSALQNMIDRIPFRNSDTNSLLKAILSGNRTDISPEIVSAFRKSGASHILALSGLHLGIIYGLVSKLTCLLGGSKTSRMIRCIINLTICAVYSLATGGSASIIRALTFIILNEIGRISHRPSTLARILRKSLMINLIISPWSILEVGFQLSYAAMAGIAWIHPVLKSAWPDDDRKSIMKKIWETASLSISCQLTTAPLVYLYFGTFPIYFLLTNLLALPLIGFIIPVSVITLILNAIGICPQILFCITEKAAAGLISALEIISRM